MSGKRSGGGGRSEQRSGKSGGRSGSARSEGLGPLGAPPPIPWLGWCLVTMIAACWSAGLGWPSPQPPPLHRPLPQ